MKKYDRILKEFRNGAASHMGEEVTPGEPSCMYWMKHQEAALIVAALLHSSQRGDLPSTLLKWYYTLAVKIALQWNKYERSVYKK